MSSLSAPTDLALLAERADHAVAGTHTSAAHADLSDVADDIQASRLDAESRGHVADEWGRAGKLAARAVRSTHPAIANLADLAEVPVVHQPVAVVVEVVALFRAGFDLLTADQITSG